jgi:RNA polymerase sigma-70 factor, ECF subfamily
MERFALMTENQNDKNLLADCKNGNRESFESLYNQHQRRVFSVALNFFGGDESLAKDITQQVFLKIFEKINEFRGESEFTTWLYRMTVNACIDEQRKRKRFFSLDNFFGEFRVKKSVDDKFQQKQISEEVQKVVAKLKTEYRLPILLKYVEGLSYQEIADVLECSIGTVSSRLNRGHKLLAQKLGHLRNEI